MKIAWHAEIDQMEMKKKLIQCKAKRYGKTYNKQTYMQMGRMHNARLEQRTKGFRSSKDGDQSD